MAAIVQAALVSPSISSTSFAGLHDVLKPGDDEIAALFEPDKATKNATAVGRVCNGELVLETHVAVSGSADAGFTRCYLSFALASKALVVTACRHNDFGSLVHSMRDPDSVDGLGNPCSDAQAKNNPDFNSTLPPTVPTRGALLPELA